MWLAITNIKKEQQGAVLSMTIPVDSKKYGDDLREDLFDNVDPAILTNNLGGVKLVLDYLKLRIGKRESINFGIVK